MSGRRGRAKSPTAGEQTPAASPSGPVWRRTWAALVSIGAIGGFVNLIEQGWKSFVFDTEPQIEFPALATDPFSLPFSIKNNSPIFALRETQWRCRIDRIERATGSLTLWDADYTKAGEITPGKAALARCYVQGDGKFGATITALVKYKTLWFSREADPAAFTWLADAQPPRWIAGRPIDPFKP
jgi:hypothetical protein